MEFPFTNDNGVKFIGEAIYTTKNGNGKVGFKAICPECSDEFITVNSEWRKRQSCRLCQPKLFSKKMSKGHPKYFASTLNGMRSRTTNPNNKSYHRYGGRGITVCDRWMHKDNGLENFINDMGERPTGFTLDRTDNDGNYEPSNCRWVTPYEQAKNRNELRLEHRGTVVKNERGSKYAAQVNIGGNKRFLGSFSTQEDAQRCIDEVVKAFNDYAFANPLSKA